MFRYTIASLCKPPTFLLSPYLAPNFPLLPSYYHLYSFPLSRSNLSYFPHHRPPPSLLRVKKVNYGYSYTQRYHNLFGLPTIIRVPRNTSTYDTVYQAVLARCRYVHTGIEVFLFGTSHFQFGMFSYIHRRFDMHCGMTVDPLSKDTPEMRTPL